MTKTKTKTKIPAIEIFDSIQGEGIFVGAKTTFVRVKGCDCHCSWCDEPLHRDPKAKLLATNADEIMEIIKMHPSKIITLTGGNPCIYDMSELVAAIKEEGLDVHVETQGTVMPQWLRDVDFITISPKGPSSGNPTDLFKLQQMLKRFRRTAKQIKPVVMVSNKGEVSEEDMSLLRKIVKMFPRNYVVAQLGDDGKEGMEYGARYRVLCDRIHSEKELDNVRVLPQIHKIGGLR